MGFAEKRNGYYLARFSDGRGNWPTVKGGGGRAVRYGSKRDAKRAANDAEAKLRSDVQAKVATREAADPAAGRMLFATWVNLWFPGQDLAPRTMGNYKSAIETILLPEFENDALADIDPGRVKGWERKLRTRGYKSDSIRTYRGILHVIMADAATEQKISSNPVSMPRGRGRRTGKARHRGPEKPTVDPLGALLIAERAAVLSGRDDEFILVVAKAWTGARWGELVGLERPYFRMSTIRIEWQVEELDDGTFLKCPPKEDSRRTVDLPPFLTALFSRQVAATQNERVPVCSCYRRGRDTEPHPGGAFVFAGRTTRRRQGGKVIDHPAAHWRRSGFESMIFKPAAEAWFPKKAPRSRRPVPVTAEPFPGLPLRGRNYVDRSEACWTPICLGLTPDLLRHSHKTWMNEDRTDPKLSHERLGHEMDGVGARYSHVTDGMRAELTKALNERWNAALDARLDLCPNSPVKVLDELLASRFRQRVRRKFQDRPTDFPQREIT